ncbi:MAG: FAD-dependent oxidoreductase [Dehalococcoidales bacterium]|nr:FAD-dependent oxidoreductase [Dehalococcoidales bacterium]
MAKSFDVVVVGAGPGGSLAALRLARAGLRVVIVERGDHPGAKNMFGGLLHRTPVLEELIPDFAERAPLERHVYKKTLAFLTEDSAIMLSSELGGFDKLPHNGYTVFRPVFDRWLADEAVKAGALLLNRCTAEDIIRRDGRIRGGSVMGREGVVEGNAVIAADGVLSFLAKKAGLRRDFRPENMGLGVKLLLGLPEAVIDERFGLVREQGADISFVGGCGAIHGGGFLYTNLDTVSVGMVLHLDSLIASGRAPYEVLNDFLAHPFLARLLRGASPLEYSAHLVPEGGYGCLPRLYTDGMLVVGDAAGLCYTNGINLEGMNLAMTSGVLAAETLLEAFQAGDFSARVLSRYRERLEASFVLRDMKTFRHAPEMMRLDRLYRTYPRLLVDIMNEVYRTGTRPRRRLSRLVLRRLRQEVGLTGLIADGWRILRGLL